MRSRKGVKNSSSNAARQREWGIAEAASSAWEIEAAAEEFGAIEGQRNQIGWSRRSGLGFTYALASDMELSKGTDKDKDVREDIDRGRGRGVCETVWIKNRSLVSKKEVQSDGTEEAIIATAATTG